MDGHIFTIFYMVISRWRGARCREVGRDALQGHLGMDSAISLTSNRFLNQDQEQENPRFLKRPTNKSVETQ